MNRRLVLATAAVVLLVSTAGCTTIFGGISDEELDREADYDDLREDVDVVVDIEEGLLGGQYRAVYNLNATDELRLYEDRLYNEQALDVWAVRYWYPNGTMVTGSDLDVSQSRSSTRIGVPDGNGTLAFTGSTPPKEFSLPAFVDGEYVVVLPAGHRTDNFLFSRVSPGGYETEERDGRVALHWEELESDIFVRYYLARDLWLFGGLVALLVLGGGGAILYVLRKVQALQRQREELGLNVDVDDDRRRPPPGMG